LRGLPAGRRGSFFGLAPGRPTLRPERRDLEARAEPEGLERDLDRGAGLDLDREEELGFLRAARPDRAPGALAGGAPGGGARPLLHHQANSSGPSNIQA
jgi:hypothetical protein